MQPDWNNIIIALLSVLMPLALSALIKFLMDAWNVYEHQQPDRAGELQRAATLAVRAAEQMGLAGLLKDKKPWAINFVQQLLNDRGIEINVELIEGAIEAAVHTASFGKAVQPDGIDAIRQSTAILPDPEGAQK